ncbi:MAG: hypothetical protein EXR60_04855 [Dehalococcoidia bacterium]|nr:hypothetical protein [Dehalococcoidia bacterium]
MVAIAFLFAVVASGIVVGVGSPFIGLLVFVGVFAGVIAGLLRGRRTLPTLEDHLLRLARTGVTGFLSGLVAGVIAGGLGSRLVMRILAVANPAARGLETENWNIAGQITADGSIGLIIFGGAFTGVFGGLLYVAIRRWVPGKGLWKGLAFGLFLLLVFGGVLFDPDNKDFGLFGPPALAVALFALLFPLYGLLVSALAERFDRYVPPLFGHPAVSAIGYLGLAGLGAFGLFHTVAAINALM